MRRRAATGSLLALVLAANTQAAADTTLQATCSQNTKSVSELVACMKAGLALPPPAATPSNLECATAHRGPFVAPVEGKTVMRFGEKTQYGTTSKGAVLQTQQGASVRAPKAGTVIFAGEYRAYGKLVILLSPCDLQFILAGASMLTVKAADVVADGQPIGTMPVGSPDAQASKPDSGPVLYVELHKSGSHVDPGAGIAGP